MKRIAGAIGRGARRAVRFAWWGLLLLPFLAIPMSYGVEYSNTPQFCSSCHIMEPFYDAWKAGSHSSVACVKCHYPPDVKGKLWTKFQGLAQLVSYVTATESTRPSAHVHDGSCTQCHDLDRLPGKRAFGTVAFDHGPHLLASHPGHELKCTSCHTQMTRDRHMDIDRTACFLCHLMGQQPGHAVGGCTSCHALPAKIVEYEGLPFDHGTVIARGMSCASCHKAVTEGTGAVTRNRCLQCHASPPTLAALEAAQADVEAKEQLHHEHVKLAAVSCRSCHDEIEHGKGANKRPHSASGDCSACHVGGHGIESAFAAGKGARGIEGRPDFMFHLGMSCESCHRESGGHMADPSASCFGCHGKGVRGMVEGWKSALGEWTTAIHANLEKVSTAIGPTLPEAVAKRLDEVRENVGLVKRARGIHNIRYGEEILRQADASLRDLAKQSGKEIDLGAIALPTGDKDCASCHLGAERITGVHEGYPFPHAPHVGKAHLSCDDCHSAGKPHGKVDMPPKRCTECHHTDDNENCASCHADVARLHAGEGLPGIAAKPDSMKAQVPCSACHNDRAAKDQAASIRKMCVECHDAKYGPMLDDWLKEGAALATTLAERTTSARVSLLDGDRSVPGYAEARGIVDDAEKLAEALRKGRFSHNPVAVRAAVEDLKARVARVPELVGDRH